jgi:hypothetical protein
MRSLPTAVLVALALTSLVACGAPSGRSVIVPFGTSNDSGVTGNVTLTAIDAQRTRVEIHVTATGFPDMPAHIHPGSCADSIPQPKYPLANVRDGVSVTEVNEGLDDLRGGPGSLNLHASNDNMRFITACADMEEGAAAGEEPAGTHMHMAP